MWVILEIHLQYKEHQTLAFTGFPCYRSRKAYIRKLEIMAKVGPMHSRFAGAGNKLLNRDFHPDTTYTKFGNSDSSAPKVSWVSIIKHKSTFSMGAKNKHNIFSNKLSKHARTHTKERKKQ